MAFASFVMVTACAGPAAVTTAPLADPGSVAPVAAAASPAPSAADAHDDEVAHLKEACATLRGSLEATRDPEEIAKLEAALKEMEDKLESATGHTCEGAAALSRPDAGVTPTCNCRPGDPLCTCF